MIETLKISQGLKHNITMTIVGVRTPQSLFWERDHTLFHGLLGTNKLELPHWHPEQKTWHHYVCKRHQRQMCSLMWQEHGDLLPEVCVGHSAEPATSAPIHLFTITHWSCFIKDGQPLKPWYCLPCLWKIQLKTKKETEIVKAVAHVMLLHLLI